MNTLTLVSVVLAALASLVACITAARNFAKGWREKLIAEQHELDDIADLKDRVAKLEQQMSQRGPRR